MSFKVIENKLLKKYTKISGRVSSLMNIEFQSQTVYGDNDKYIKTKIRSYEHKVNTNFQGIKIPERKCIMQIFVIDNIRLLLEQIKVLSSNTPERIQV